MLRELTDEAPAAVGPITADELARAEGLIGAITAQFRGRVVGQDRLRLALLVTLLAGGHILLESLPGLAKTTAAATLARASGGTFARIQCTPDLLPSDIIGTQVFDAATASFRTQLGPVHANFVLLDEINRASAKTQSALLEAMQERQTSIGGETYRLPEPFVVLATQNPIEEDGTYVLPHAQLDRFLLNEIIDYPAPAAEFEVLRRIDSLAPAAGEPGEAAVSLDALAFLQALVSRVYVDDAIRHYIVRLVGATRHPADAMAAPLADYVEHGASPRGAIALQQVARALAVVAGRSHVIPEDVKELRHAVLRHRIRLSFEAQAEQIAPESVLDAIFAAVTSP